MFWDLPDVSQPEFLKYSVILRTMLHAVPPPQLYTTMYKKIKIF